MTPEQKAEIQIREAVSEAHLQNMQLDAFVSRVPTMRTSDLFAYLIYSEMLHTALFGIPQEENDLPSAEQEKLIFSAAMIALQDEIDRRIPVPSSHESLRTGPRVYGCSCGWSIASIDATDETCALLHSEHAARAMRLR